MFIKGRTKSPAAGTLQYLMRAAITVRIRIQGQPEAWGEKTVPADA